MESQGRKEKESRRTVENARATEVTTILPLNVISSNTLVG